MAGSLGWLAGAEVAGLFAKATSGIGGAEKRIWKAVENASFQLSCSVLGMVGPLAWRRLADQQTGIAKGDIVQSNKVVTK